MIVIVILVPLNFLCCQCSGPPMEEWRCVWRTGEDTTGSALECQPSSLSLVSPSSVVSLSMSRYSTHSGTGPGPGWPLLCILPGGGNRGKETGQVENSLATLNAQNIKLICDI